MEYKIFDKEIVVRIDRGEEIVATLNQIAETENIKLASVSAIGAVGKFKTSVYNVIEKKYYSNEFEGDFEIVSLLGTITTMDQKPFIHLHMSVGNDKGEVLGGHLNEAYVSAVCEMVIKTIDGVVERQYDENTGLNILKF